MTAMLRRLAGACAAAAVLWQAPAMAECPETALQSAADNFIAIGQPGADVSGILGAIDALVEACPTSPHVLKTGAMTYANGALADTENAVDHYTTSLNLISRMWDNIEGHTAKSVIDQNGKTQIVGFTDLYDLKKYVLNGLLQAELTSGVSSPYTQPLAEGEAQPACRSTDKTDVSIASTWIRSHGDHPGAYNLMDRMIARCDADMADRRYTGMLGLRARALLASIQHDPRQDGALAKAERAKADSERFVALNGGYDSVAWLKSDTLNLERATGVVRATMQPAVLSPDMFRPPRLNNPETEYSLALLLDEAWAKDADAGLAGGYAAYREAISQAFEMTRPLDDPDPARLMLFNAAEAHASGAVRAPGHESLEPPPAFLYNWIKPENYR
ncbi:MAG: hypothetical protein KDA53_07100 [Hyphomonas sp.]|nr:hypothetical protein [Hyphomonas sp.]